MHVFEIIIALLLAGAGLTSLSRRIGTPYPAMVALAGAALALVPGTPTLVLDPELALTLFVAPVLLDAAYDASLRDLRANGLRWTRAPSSRAFRAACSGVFYARQGLVLGRRKAGALRCANFASRAGRAVSPPCCHWHKPQDAPRLADWKAAIERLFVELFLEAHASIWPPWRCWTLIRTFV